MRAPLPRGALAEGEAALRPLGQAQLEPRRASVAEVDHRGLAAHQLTIACVARKHHELERLLDEAERWLRGQEWEVALVERFIVDPDD